MAQQINLYSLLPQPIPQYVVFATIVRVSVAFMVLLLLISSCQLWYKYDRSNQLAVVQRQNESAAKNLAQLTKQNSESLEEAHIVDMKAALEQELIEKKQAVLMLGKGEKFSTYLDALGKVIVPGIWLTQIELSEASKECTLKGVTRKPSLVPEFLAKLDKEAIFEGKKFVGFQVAEHKPAAEQQSHAAQSDTAQFDFIISTHHLPQDSEGSPRP